jgi:GAF domain-containing protein
MAGEFSHQEELARLEFLRSLNILDTDKEEAFDRIAEASADVCNTPMAIISLIDEGRQWMKSAKGLEIRETDRSVAFCNYTIRSRFPFIVEDAVTDPRLQNNPLVLGPPHLRFYAGFPLVFPQGFIAGSLAVMDVIPRQLNPAQINFLAILAQQAVALIEMRRQREELKRAVQERLDMHARLQLLDASIARISDTVMITESGTLEEPGPRIVFVNDAFETDDRLQQK